LTTRIECSRRPTQIGPPETNSSRFNYGPSTFSYWIALDHRRQARRPHPGQ